MVLIKREKNKTLLVNFKFVYIFEFPPQHCAASDREEPIFLFWTVEDPLSALSITTKITRQTLRHLERTTIFTGPSLLINTTSY